MKHYNLFFCTYSSTIRTKPENVWIASVVSKDEVVFDSWDGLAQDVDKERVLKMWNAGEIKTERLSTCAIPDYAKEEMEINSLKNPGNKA